MAKGCGMLAPNMATMLAFLTTDAELSPDGAEADPVPRRRRHLQQPDHRRRDLDQRHGHAVRQRPQGPPGRPRAVRGRRPAGVRGADAADGARCGGDDQAGRHPRHRRGQRRRGAQGRPLDRQQPADQVQLVRRRRLLGPAAGRSRLVRRRVRDRERQRSAMAGSRSPRPASKSRTMPRRCAPT